MAVSTLFNERLQLVDDTKSFTYSIDAGYEWYEFSVSGWTVTAGSEIGCEHGAHEALYDMGFRFYAPNKEFLPASVPSGGTTIAKMNRAYYDSRVYETYAGGNEEASDAFHEWYILNGVNIQQSPAGHAYSSIINAIEAEDGFFTANPTYKVGSGATQTFNLDLTDPDYTTLVNRVGDHIVANELNSLNRASIEPPDGDDWTTDQVMDFATAVCARVRQTYPDALLGVYVYSGHRLPPTNSHPTIYAQITTQFNDTPYTYLELFELWGAKVHSISIRDYGMIPNNNDFHPFERDICKTTSFANNRLDYTAFYESGARGVNMETSPNFLPGLVGLYRFIRLLVNSTQNYADTLDEIVDNLYGGDAGVKALYEYWSTNSVAYNAASLSKSCDLIDAIQPANRAEFERYMAFILLHWDAHENEPEYSPGYFRKLEQCLRWSEGMVLDQTIHAYGYQRDRANANVNDNGRPDLRLSNDPHWERYPVKPTTADYQALRDAHKAPLQRPAALDDTTLALCEVSPTYAETSGATNFITEAGSDYAYIGPGDVTFRVGEPEEETISYGAGIHFFSTFNLVSWSGGTLFLNSFPEIEIDAAGHTGTYWLYIPKAVRGRVYIGSGQRAVMRYEATPADWVDVSTHLPPFGDDFDPRDFPAGHVRLSFGSTRPDFKNINCGPYISPVYNRALMPKALAELEGLTILAEY